MDIEKLAKLSKELHEMLTLHTTCKMTIPHSRLEVDESIPNEIANKLLPKIEEKLKEIKDFLNI